MEIAANIEKLARECFARLCPWIAKEYPDWPIDRSTTMTAFVEGAALNKVRIGYMSYEYDKKYSPYCHTFYYLTLNGRQVGTVMFSLREALEKIESVKRGEDL